MTKKKALIAALCAGATALLVGGIVFGWDLGAALIAVGCGLGAFLGGQVGNRQAREVDEYREQWLSKRKRRTIPRRESE